MIRLGATALGAVTIGCLAWPGLAQNAGEATFTRVSYPANFEKTFRRYDRVDKVDRKIVRDLYINAEALAAVKPGEPFPEGTVLVMVNRTVALEAGGAPIKGPDGRLQPTQRVTLIEVMEKRAGWGETNLLPADKDNGDWEYASFKPDGTPNPIKLEGCYSCHLAQKSTDFTFSGGKIYDLKK